MHRNPIEINQNTTTQITEQSLFPSSDQTTVVHNEAEQEVLNILWSDLPAGNTLNDLADVSEEKAVSDLINLNPSVAQPMHNTNSSHAEQKIDDQEILEVPTHLSEQNCKKRKTSSGHSVSSPLLVEIRAILATAQTSIFQPQQKTVSPLKFNGKEIEFGILQELLKLGLDIRDENCFAEDGPTFYKLPIEFMPSNNNNNLKEIFIIFCPYFKLENNPHFNSKIKSRKLKLNSLARANLGIFSNEILSNVGSIKEQVKLMVITNTRLNQSTDGDWKPAKLLEFNEEQKQRLLEYKRNDKDYFAKTLIEFNNNLLRANSLNTNNNNNNNNNTQKRRPN